MSIQIMKKQKGNILIVFTIGLFVLIGMSALALDGGHLLLNKNRLQNYVDSAALNAAKTLDSGGSHNDARAAVVEILTANLAHNDAYEIDRGLSALPTSGQVLTANQITAQLLVQFSERPDPFLNVEPPTAEAVYVRVEVKNVILENFLADIFNLQKNVYASAAAGPSTAIVYCSNDIVPMMICGDVNQPDNNWGFDSNTLQALKIDSDPNSPIGPGNFQLIDLEGNHGANDVSHALAGSGASTPDTCFLTGEGNASIPTAPGNQVGPVADGLNTRFGHYFGQMGTQDYNIQYPRDSNTCEGELITLDDDGNIIAPSNYYTYDDYLNDNLPAKKSCNMSKTLEGDWIASTGPNDGIKLNRREIRVAIGDCGDGSINGSNDVDFLGFGCFFLTQQTPRTGNTSFVIGEFHRVCSGTGWPSGIIEDKPGPYTIVLYHVPFSTSS